jgi:hypothetical protein
MKPIKEMTSSEMVVEYNTLTGKSIKKFATRADGERQLNNARKAHELIHSMIGETTPEEKKIIQAKKDAVVRAKKAKAEKMAAEKAVKTKKAREKEVAKNKAVRKAETVARKEEKRKNRPMKAERELPEMTVKSTPFKRVPTTRTIRAALIEAIMAGKTNREATVAARLEFKGGNVPSGYASWYRAQLRRLGVITY